MNRVQYTRYELLRAFRNPGFFVFSLGFPLVLYYVIAGPNHDARNFGDTGLSAPVYYMAGLASFGTMASMISTGARIAGERQAGWTRRCGSAPSPPALTSGRSCSPPTRWRC